jgi:ABC-type branched-subunit amino acid transport system ATPase component
MLALARGLVARPRVLMIDELSLGLAPRVVEQLFSTIAELKARHQTILLVEQYVTHALGVGDVFYILNQGRVAAITDRGELVGGDLASQVYLGTAEQSAPPRATVAESGRSADEPPARTV